MVTVSNEAPAQKDIMKLVIILAFLAFSSAEDQKQPVFDDLLAVESVQLLKEGVDLKPASSEYYVPNSAQWKLKSWDQQNQQNNWNQQNSWNQPQNTWTQPQNTWTQPQNTWTQQEVKPIQPVNTYPQVSNDYYPSQPSWSTPHYHSTTTTPIPVIKNEQYYGDNGSYKYEYQIADGTHVGEEGYFTDPKGTDESLVKKGWYSYVGADGKTYTVTYWADKTGFHAYGDHLPTPPPVPAAIQAALDKEAQNQQNQNQQYPIYSDTYYTTTSAPYYPNYPNYPANQQYPNNQQTYPQTYPQTQHGYGK